MGSSPQSSEALSASFLHYLRGEITRYDSLHTNVKHALVLARESFDQQRDFLLSQIQDYIITTDIECQVQAAHARLAIPRPKQLLSPILDHTSVVKLAYQAGNRFEGSDSMQYQHGNESQIATALADSTFPNMIDIEIPGTKFMRIQNDLFPSSRPTIHIRTANDYDSSKISNVQLHYDVIVRGLVDVVERMVSPGSEPGVVSTSDGGPWPTDRVSPGTPASYTLDKLVFKELACIQISVDMSSMAPSYKVLLSNLDNVAFAGMRRVQDELIDSWDFDKNNSVRQLDKRICHLKELSWVKHVSQPMSEPLDELKLPF